MPHTLLLVFTHLLAAAVGAGLAYFVVLRAAGEKVEPPLLPQLGPHSRGEHMSEESDARQKRADQNDRRLVVMLLVASVIVAAIGVQAYRGQQEDQRQRACFGAVVTQMNTALAVRSQAAEMLAQAEERREHALDNLIRVVVRSRQQPPPATKKELSREFDIALARFTEARRNLDDVRVKVEGIRDSVQYDPDAAAACSDGYLEAPTQGGES